MSNDDPIRAGIDAFLDWATERGHLQAFQEITQEFMEVCEEVTGMDFEDVATVMGEGALAPVFGMILESYVSIEYESGFLIDGFLEETQALLPLEKEYLRALGRSVPSLYEVVDVVPKSHLVLRDQFGSGELESIREEELSQTLVQWDWIFARIVRMGEEGHLSGCTILMESVDREEFEELVRDMATRHVKKMPKALRKSPGVGARALRVALRSAPALAAAFWIGARLERSAPPRLTVTGGDPMCPTALEYSTVEGPSAVAAVLDAAPDFVKTFPGSWLWTLEEEESPAVIRAFVKLDGDRLFVASMSAERADECTAHFRDLFGLMLQLERRWEGPIAEIMAVAAPSDLESDELLEPEVLEAATAELMERHYRGTLDEPVPMLGHRSPRELVKTAVGRERVAAWLKYLEHEQGIHAIPAGNPPFDFLPLWEELGIADLRR
ncbi:MAG: MbcA/ParS/Xre antitoxin family protein [Fimbriimonadaceae bacterium]|nr:MbcA/ParS/Xre antitoxin family protein [Fimbriimonadaceae bacterium]